ncbi:glycosyltransferase family 2 protein [Candidatus Woesearchaeota archaeon]|nr:glycosyltransferase family 2 protein [Candidatus Woesearchaeota archaeon]
MEGSQTSISISVILPCRNEEKTVGECIQKIRKAFENEGISGEIIVSDSSNDGSADIAKELGAIVVRHGKEGYGYAYQEGFKASKGDIIIIGDADGTYDFSEIPKLLSKSEGNDLVIGSRLKGDIKKGAMPWHHRYIGNPVLSMLLRVLFRSRVSDTQSGFRLVKRKAWEKLSLHTTGMEFASEMIIRAGMKGLRVAEVPITYYPRKIGSKSKLRSFRDGWKHLRFMMLYSPSLIFLFPGLLLLIAGLAMLFLFSNLLNPLLSSLLIILSYQVIMLSVFAKTYASVHLGQRSRLVDLMNRHLSLERGMLLGLAFLAAGSVMMIMYDIRLPSLVVLVMGLQTFFSAFFLSIIGIEER